ncbi:MAG: DUF935 family protein [Bacteroidota bacterium]
MKIGKYNISIGKETEVFADHANHPNALNKGSRIELAKDILSKKKVLIELKEQGQQLAQNEIRDWRSANQFALNHENPKRFLLNKIFYDAMLDDHVLGAIRNRKLKVMRTKFKIVDQNGKENPDMTKLIQGRWFKKFMSLSLDSIFHGHSLIQLGDIIRDPKLKFADVELLPRNHIIPEYHVIIKEVMDEPKQGFDYLKPPFSDWCVSVGDPKDLGLLLPVSKDAISKKYALQFWDQFAEVFGMPVRVGKSSTRNKKDLDKIETMLEEMGSAAWGLFPEGTTIDIIETKRGDAFNVYDKRIARANSEISKAILGQTMTMDDGASKSQAQVHADVAEYIAEADADFLKDVINDDLIPLLIKHGWPFANFTFDWDTTHEYTPKEMKDIEEMLLEYYEIDPSHFVEKYNIKITGVKQLASNNPPKVDEKKKLSLVARPSYDGVHCCGAEHEDHITLAKPSINKKPINSELIRLIWDNRKTSYSFEYFEWLNKIYLHAITSGWKKESKLKLAADVKLDFDTPDYMTMQMFELNVFSFSAAKSAAAVRELNVLAKQHDTFSKFSKEASDKILHFYNDNALKAEYNHAWATSQNAAEYHRLMKLKKEFPTWQYMTVGDDRVRDAHRALRGKKFKAGDIDSIYPPNGWGCRCYVKPLTGVAQTYTSPKQAEDILAQSGIDKNGVSEWDRMIKGGFNKNRAKTRTIYDVDKHYLKSELSQKLTYKDQGLEAFANIDKTSLPKITVKERDFTFATKLLADNANLFTDYTKRKIAFSSKTLKAHNKADRLNIIEFVPEILESPDEVFMSEKGSSKTIQLKYIKHYNDRSLIIVSDISDEGMNIKTWFEADKDKFDRDWRSGILIKKSY